MNIKRSILLNELYLVWALLVLMFIGACQSRTVGEQPQTNEVVVNKTEEAEIELEDLEGRPVDLNEYRGKVVFLNFWATWCKPCVAEMPSIDRLKMELGNEQYVFLAASDENMEKIQKFVEKYPHEFQYVRLKTNIYKLGLSVLPTTYIINREGEVVEKIVGAREWDSPESIKRLKEI